MGFSNEEMEDEGFKSSSENQLCLAGCGFFGAPCFKGYCSKCYTQLEIAKIASESNAQIDEATTNYPLNNQSNATTNVQSFTAAIQRKESQTTNCPTEDATTCTDDQAEAAQPPPFSDALNEKNINKTVKIEDPQQSKATVPTLYSQETPQITNESPLLIAKIDEEPEMPKIIQKNKKLCAVCNRKLKLTDFECRCGLRLCSEHRYTDRHECTVNYRLKQQEQLGETILKIAPKKLDDF